MVCTVQFLGLHGVSGYPVSAERALSGGLPAFDIAGLPDAARAIQNARFGPDGPTCNAHMSPKELSVLCQLDESCQDLIRGAYEKLGLTARSYDRILRVARTIANLDESDQIQLPPLAEALQYRPPEHFNI